jgi:hypothetical protein
MAKEILTSIHGKEIGLDVDRNLVCHGKQVTDISAEVGAKNGSTVVETYCIDGPVRKVKLTLTATPFTFTDVAGSGQYSGVKIYGFPEGLLLFLGGVVTGSLTLIDTTGTWLATWEGDVGVGTAAIASADGMTSTEQDLIQTGAIAAATAKVGTISLITTATALTESGARWLDGTATAKDMYLNFEIDDNGGHVNGDGGTFTGTVEFAYMILGDK